MAQGAKREAVIQAALALVAERGFHGSPMAEIAARAGVAAGTIYRFFDGKDALIRDVHAALEAQILASVSADYPAAGTARERFAHIGRRTVAYFLTHPLQFRFLEQFNNSPYGVACRRERLFGKRRRNLITDLFEEARREGVAKDLPLTVLFALGFGPLVDLCRDGILEFIRVDDRLLERTVVACWDAVRRHPEADGPGAARP